VVGKRSSATESDLWIVDLARGTMSRFTFGPGRVDSPIWSPDGTRIVFSSDRGGTWDLYEKPVAGTQDPEPLLTGGSILKYSSSWSPDGKTILFVQLDEHTGWDILAMPMEGERVPTPYVRNSYDQTSPHFSPDGRWVSYTSTESGRPEIYVQAFPTPGRKFQVSTNGGDYSIWRADGRQIAFAATGGVQLVDVQTGAEVQVGAERVARLRDAYVYGYLMKDFARMLAIIPVQASNASGTVTVLLNWRQELKEK